MKKIFYVILTAAAIFTGCSREADVENPANYNKRHVTIQANINQTKSTVTDEGVYSWSANETIGVVEQDGSAVISFRIADAEEGLFSGTLTVDKDPVFAVSPAGFVSGVSESGGDIEYDITLDNIDNYVPGTTNAIMVAEYSGKDGDNYKFHFNHIAALIKVPVVNIPVGTAKVKLTLDKNITGIWADLDSTTPTLNEDTDLGEPSLTLTLKKSVTNPNTSANYYFPVPCNTYTSFQFEMLNADGDRIKGMKKTGLNIPLSAADLFITPTITLAPVAITKGAEWTYTFTAKKYEANGTQTLTDSESASMDWTLDGSYSDTGYWAYDGTKGQQFGSGAKPYSSLTLTADSGVNGIEDVVINTSGASSITATVSVSVGGTPFVIKGSDPVEDSADLTATATEYTFTSPDGELYVGDIVISYENSSSKAIYIKTISLNPDTRIDPELAYATAAYNVLTSSAFETPTLSTADGFNGTVTYAIGGEDDPDVASVNANTGAVTIGSKAGSVTVTASFAGNATYKPGSASYTITVTDGSTPTPTTGWFETALADLTSSDVFVIVGNDTYTISNAQSTSAAPAGATLASASVTISGTTPNRSLSGTIPDGVKWTLTGNGTDGYTFYSNANSSYHLYNSTTANSKSNDAMRVGNPSSGTDRKLFVLENNQLVTKDSYTARYLACYTTTPDWRGYTSSSTSATTITFYKYVAAPDNREEAGMSWSSDSATATYSNGNSLSFTAPTLTPGNATGITYESTDETIATINASGVVTITALSDNNVKEASTTIKAVFEGNEDYKPQTVSYTLTVVDSRTAVSTPTFDPAAGEVAANTTVNFQCADSDVTYHYTVNGSDPTVESPTAASVTIDAAKTVKVLATKTGYKPSAVASAVYTIAGVVEVGTLSDPYTVAEAISAYQANSSIGSKYVKGIVCQEGNSYCYISDDGTTTNKFELYSFSGSISCSSLKVGDAVIAHGTLAYYSGGSVYEINGTTVDVHISKPVFTPDGANFVGSQSVAITSTNSSSIRYTTDGTAPTISTGEVYSAALNLTASSTVKAVGIDENEVICTAVASATFTKLQTYAVTWSAPSNGTITVKNGETTLSSGDLVPETATVNITVSPADGYALSTLVYNDGSDHDIKAAKSFTMPSHAVSITATFEETGGGSATPLDDPAVNITVINASTFTGTWTKNDNASDYDWYISTKTSFAAAESDYLFKGNTSTSGCSLSSNTYTVTKTGTFASGTTYYFYVLAKGDGSTYADSNNAGKKAKGFIIIDGSQLTSTATTSSTDKTYSGITVNFSDGAKSQAIQSGANNNFTSSPSILIGKSGKNIHNTSALPGSIEKFEIYSNKGASKSVSVGLNFSSSVISSYSTSATNKWSATLSTNDNVYNCTGIGTGSKYFFYQVTNANNSQVQFRITYVVSDND